MFSIYPAILLSMLSMLFHFDILQPVPIPSPIVIMIVIVIVILRIAPVAKYRMTVSLQQ